MSFPIGPMTFSIGSPEKREVDSQIIKNCRLFTDKKESLLNEAGDFIIPMREGTVAKEHLTGELSDLVTGKVLGKYRDGLRMLTYNLSETKQK